MSSLLASYAKLTGGIKSGSDFESWLAGALGLIAGSEPEVKFGHSTAVGPSLQDVWKYGPTQATYIFPDDAGEIIEILGDVAGDKGIDIIVEGLGTDGLFQSEAVALDAVTAITPVALLKTWRSVHRAYNDNGVELTGNVLVRGDGSTSVNVFAYVSPDDQQTAQTPYMVPADKVAIISNYSTAINKLSPAASAFFALRVAKPGKIFRNQIRYGLQSTGTSNISSDLIAPVVVGPLSRVKVSAQASTNGVDVSAEYSMLLIDKDSIGPDILESLG